MKKSVNIWILLSLIMLLLTNLSFGQVDDEFDEFGEEAEEQVVDIKCKPDSLVSTYEILFKQDSSIYDQTERLKNLSLGYEYFKQKNYSQAIPYLWKYVAAGVKDRYYNTVMKKLMESYYNLGKEEKGEKALALMDTALLVIYKALQDDENNAIFHYWGGTIQSMVRRYKCAIPHYEKLTELEPENKGYWAVLAGLYFAVKDDRAINAQQKVIELDPADTEAREKLAHYTKRLGGDLLKVYEENYKKNPNNVEFARKYAEVALKEEMYDQAIGAFKKVLELEPADYNAVLKLGMAYQSKAQYKTAINYYKKYLNHKSNDVAIYVNIADCYRGLKSYSSAVSYANKGLRVKPGYGGAYIVIAKTYMDAVNQCSAERQPNKGLTYDDKLVYEKAYRILAKAKKDEMFASQAFNLMKSLESVLPSKEDKFLHNNRTNIKDACYSWIQ
ncbi:MAG: hypothetical protein Kow00108_01340 [Calditrichia bacterium]